ncbi:uncharacterized protein [Typha angustifolia]|uniref:uncharacterized protein n=1 Tax=Typha angustifolia TaxID=59011 RepID=UPI003C2CA956
MQSLANSDSRLLSSSRMATETKPAAAEGARIDPFEGKDEPEIDQDEIWDDASDDGLNRASGLSREWQWRHNQFHTMGYRDGITAGKEASAQEGFNAGFKQSMHVGYKWGLVRGITSALAKLSESSKEKLVPSYETRERFENVHKSVQAISTDDALKMYHKYIFQNGSMQSCDHPEQKSQVNSMVEKTSNSNQLESLFEDLNLLLNECPGIEASEELRHGTIK